VLSFSGDDPDDPTALTAKLNSFAQLGVNMVIEPNNDLPGTVFQFSVSNPNMYVLGMSYPSNATMTGKNSEFTTDVTRAYYPMGILAGLMTKTNTIGFVTAFWFGETSEWYNAFKAGALSVNPNVKVLYATTNDWADPVKGASAASGLISAGADVVLGAGDGMTDGVIQQCATSGVYSFGYLFDQSSLAPKTVITSSIWNTAPYFETALGRIFNGTYGGQDWDNPNLGQLGPIASWVPTSAATQATNAMAKIQAGTLTIPLNATQP